MRVFAGAIGLLLLAGSAEAQANPESGDTGGRARGSARAGAQAQGTWQPPTGQGQMMMQQQQQQQQPQPQPQPDMGLPPDAGAMPPDAGAMPPAEPEPPPSDSDHAAVVGHFGIGFFGVLDLPVMGCDLSMPLCFAIGNVTLPAPTIGARYWLSDMLGVEAALGLNFGGGTSGGLESSQYGFAIHGGVPLALAHTGHFVFQVVPQLDFGLAGGTYEMGMAKTDFSGLLFDIGAKAGAEIHFGFIDIPQLSLQGTIGLMVRHENRKAETTPPAATAALSVEQSSTTVTTGVDGEPWDIFTGSITAIYYF